jgi:hypothetical protein
LNDLLDTKVSPVFQSFFVEGMDMPPNITEASANPMAPTTQQDLGVTIASFISTASGIPMASPIQDGIQLDSAISARSSTIPVASAILEQLGIPKASTVPPLASPHFTPVAPTVLTPTTPILAPIPGQTIMSPAWLEDPLRYRAAMTPPSCVPLDALITPEVEPVFLHVSYFFTLLYDNMKKLLICITVNC